MYNQVISKHKHSLFIFTLFFITIASSFLSASSSYLYTSGNPIMEIDLSTGQIKRIIDMYGFGLAYLEPNILLVTDSNHSLYIFDLETLNQIKVINNVGPCARHVYVTPDGKFAFVLNNNSNDLSVIDLSNYTYLKDITVGGPSYSGPNGLAFDPENHLAYVANHYGSPDISIIDYENLIKVGEIDYGGYKPKECDIHLADNLLYIANGGGGGSNSLTIYDLTNSTVLKTLGTSTDPSGLIISENFQKLYLSCIGSSLVQILDTNTNEFIHSINMGGYPAYPHINDDGSLICFSREMLNCVSIIDVETDQTTTYSVGNAPRCVLFVSSNNKPVAKAGADQVVILGETVQLDGSDSCDPDDDPLTYDWNFISKPFHSLAELSDPNLMNPTFVVDEVGEYVIQLIVNDGKIDSDPDLIMVTAKSVIETIQDLIIYIEALKNDDTLNNGQANALIAKLQNSIIKLNQGKIKTTINILGACINQVEDFIEEDTLPGDKGQWMTDWINRILGVLQNGLGKQVAESEFDVNNTILANEFRLYENYPNPFNPQTKISYTLPEPSHVSLIIYNISGERVYTLEQSRKSAGHHSIIWDGRDTVGRLVSGGIYIVRIQAGTYNQTIRMLLMK